MGIEKEEGSSPDSSPQQPSSNQVLPMHNPAETPDENSQEEDKKELISSLVQRIKDVAPHNTPAVARQERQACKSGQPSAQPSGTEKEELV
jgi:hypothetical protein